MRPAERRRVDGGGARPHKRAQAKGDAGGAPAVPRRPPSGRRLREPRRRLRPAPAPRRLPSLPRRRLLPLPRRRHPPANRAPVGFRVPAAALRGVLFQREEPRLLPPPPPKQIREPARRGIGSRSENRCERRTPAVLPPPAAEQRADLWGAVEESVAGVGGGGGRPAVGVRGHRPRGVAGATAQGVRPLLRQRQRGQALPEAVRAGAGAGPVRVALAPHRLRPFPIQTTRRAATGGS